MTKKIIVFFILMLLCVIWGNFTDVISPLKTNSALHNCFFFSRAEAQQTPESGASQVNSSQTAQNPFSLPPQVVFRNAREALHARNIVSASIRESLQVHNQLVSGVGQYKEKIDNQKRFLRMEMTYSCNETRHSILYLADGSNNRFWISKNIGKKKTVARVDTFLLNAQNANPDLVTSVDGVPITPISLAGIPFMLSQIEQSFNLISCSHFTQPKTNQDSILIQGEWKPEKFPLKEFVKNKTINWENAPDEIPDSVNIYLGIDNLFPYRISYFRKISGKNTLIATIVFFDVSFTERLTPEQFRFAPPTNLPPQDIIKYYQKEKTP